MGRNIKVGVLIAVFLTCFLMNNTKLAVADVTDIDMTLLRSLKRTLQDRDQNDSEDTGDSRNWFEKLLDLAEKKWDDAKEYIQDEWEKFKDWSYEKWEDFKEWAPEAWDKATDLFWDGLNAIGDFFVAVWENEWVQVVVGAVVATGAIIGGLLLFGTPIGWGFLQLSVGAHYWAVGFISLLRGTISAF